MKRLRDLGEDALVARLVRHFPTDGLAVGPGDDCAVVDPGRGRLRLLKTDAIVAGVHFEPEAPPARVGWKAVARVISDFAAMGGRPEFLMVTVALPPDTTVRWVEQLYRGMRRCMERHGGVLAGGETTGVPEGAPVVISIAGEGSAARGAVVTRGGGKPGDVLAVTGRLGGSIRGRHLRFDPRVREGEWLAARGTRAMMDLSDGLSKDLPRLAKACGCGAVIAREELPRHRGCSVDQAMGDGEDYELLVAIRPDKLAALEQGWPRDFAPLTTIGRLAEQGETFDGGWDHFSA